MRTKANDLSRFLWFSILARPLTTLYVLASAVVLAMSADTLDRDLALILLLGIFVVLLMLGLLRERRIEAHLVQAELDNIKLMIINSALLNKQEGNSSE